MTNFETNYEIDSIFAKLHLFLFGTFLVKIKSLLKMLYVTKFKSKFFYEKNEPFTLLTKNFMTSYIAENTGN